MFANKIKVINLFQSHLMDVHHVDASNWENYINEVEFEMDIEPEEIMP